MNITEKIARYDDLLSKADLIRMEYQKARDSLLTPELIAILEDIRAEEQTALDSLKEGADKLLAEIKEDVLAIGASVTVPGIPTKIIYNKGRVSWDTKSLDGYAAAHPEIRKFRLVGDPSVTVRRS